MDAEREREEPSSVELSPATAPPLPAPSGGSLGIVTVLLLCIAVSAMTSVASLAYYHRHYATKIRVVDMKGYVAQVRDDFVNKRIDQATMKQKLDHFDDVIRESLGEPGTVIILKEVVFADGNDIEL